MTKLLNLRNLVNKTVSSASSSSRSTRSWKGSKFPGVGQHGSFRAISTSSQVLKDRYDDDYKEFPRQPQPSDDPIGRTMRILKHDIKSVFKNVGRYSEFSSHVDILVIGGGIMGSCVAHTILNRIQRDALKVMVVEKDPTYSKSATCMSIGGLRQQFSLKENIEMAKYGAEYLRNVPRTLDCDGDPPPDLKYHPYGYLQLANEEQAADMQETWLLQKELGCHVELLTKERIAQRFPWINPTGVELGLYGIEGEGWFDAWALHFGLKKKAWFLGAEYVQGEVVGFEFETSGIAAAGEDYTDDYLQAKRAIVKTPSGELKTVHFAYCIIAAGHESSKIAEMARIGRKPGQLSVQLPVEPRKRYVYCLYAPDGPGIDCPLVVDPDGTYFRREGYAGHYVAGKSPPLLEQPESEVLEVNYAYFDNEVWPTIAKRVPAFKNVKLNSAWAGFYDYNTFDQSVVVGPHPYYHNIHFACGLSGHGIQQAPAVARAIMELILDGEYRTINLSKFEFERFYIGKKFKEKHIV